jgi:hypothetical protein
MWIVPFSQETEKKIKNKTGAGGGEGGEKGGVGVTVL